MLLVLQAILWIKSKSYKINNLYFVNWKTFRKDACLMRIGIKCYEAEFGRKAKNKIKRLQIFENTLIGLPSGWCSCPILTSIKGWCSSLYKKPGFWRLVGFFHLEDWCNWSNISVSWYFVNGKELTCCKKQFQTFIFLMTIN